MSSYEEYIMKILLKNKIKFEREKTYKDLKQGKYRYDFFLIDKNILIEIDGQYHFESIQGRITLNKQQEHDRQKNSYALAHSIPLYRIPYWELKNINSIQDILQSKFLVKSKFHNDILAIQNPIFKK